MLKKMNKALLAASVAALLVPGVANAKKADFGKIYTECGLGGLFGSAIEDKSVSKVVAIVTNITWDLGTTASISQLSSEDTCANKQVRVAAFINQTFEMLEKDLANGDGEYLDALAKLALDDANAKPAYTAALRAEFAKVVADASYSGMSRYDKVEKLYAIAI